MSEVAQVGGTHYAAEYQHWDWAEDIGLGALEYAATKYLSRWQKKDGLKDLRKAHSYIAKLLDRNKNHGRKNDSLWSFGHNARFFESAHIGSVESSICTLVCAWRNSADLNRILDGISTIIADQFPETTYSHMAVLDGTEVTQEV